MSPRVEYAPVNGEVVKWARESRGLSLNDASKRLKITPSQLDDIERDRAEPTQGLLSQMARVYRRTQGVLLLPKRPEIDETPTDFRTFRGAAAELTADARMAMRSTRGLQLFIEGLVELEPELLPAVNLPSATLSSSPESVGEAERERFGISVEAQNRIGNPLRAFQAWRASLQERGILVAVRSLDPRLECKGFSFHSQVAPLITVSSKDSANGRTFTLFHEYGHFLLGEQGTCIPGSAASSEIPSESWCNRFSAAFLMPEADLVRYVDKRYPALRSQDWNLNHVTAIATYFRVSDWVAGLRLKRVGISDVFDRIKDELEVRGYPAPPTGDGPREKRIPKRIRENGFGIATAILEGVRGNVIDAGEAAEALNLTVEQLSDLETAAALQRAQHSF